MKAAGIAVAVGTAFGVLLLATGRELVSAPSRANVRVARVVAETIEFPANSHTRIAGRFGLASTDGELLGVIGTPLWEREGIVAREWQQGHGRRPFPGEAARWTGTLHASPDDLAHAGSWTQRVVAGVTWWEIEPRERLTDLVSVHLHGLGASPASVLRSVDAALSAGLRAAVPDLRTRRSSLGEGESEALDPWFSERPTTARFVLVGWSMGAEISRHLMQRPVGRQVQSVLLLSPVLNWTATVQHSARASRIPAWWVRLALRALRGPLVPRILGMSQAASPLPAAQLGDFPLGTLAIHSQGDRVTPYAATVRARDAGAFTLFTTESAPHTLEWNVAPAVQEIARRWFADRVD